MQQTCLNSFDIFSALSNGLHQNMVTRDVTSTVFLLEWLSVQKMEQHWCSAETNWQGSLVQREWGFSLKTHPCLEHLILNLMGFVKSEQEKM